ncbi:MAG: ribonuclease J [Tissierellia bacterium]|nr:ribonuclease J [Tissierellia bacterium]
MKNKETKTIQSKKIKNNTVSVLKPKTRATQKKKKKVNGKLRIIPLGGVGEIGKNMTAIEYNDQILIIDAGLTFPDETMLGVDIVIPDFSYLEQNKHKIKGLLVTHGHEDHIGAVPYFLKKITTRVYSTRLTLGLIELKLKEHNLDTSVLKTITPGQTITLGDFKAEFISVNHSIPDACAIAIHTPIGVALFTGDFKVDFTPIDGIYMDLQRFGQLGREGVLVLLSDSTNVEKPGYTMSELSVRETFKQVFATAEERIAVATFASNLHRVQQVIDATEYYGKKLFISGRSMEKNVKIAIDLGYLKIKKDTLQNINNIDSFENNEIVLLTTGSQGEPMSALTRLSKSEHRKVKLMPNDTVIISATPIPGNEDSMGGVINNLTELGCNVVYSKLAEVHVSGHASQEELKLMLSLVRPKYFVPVHGEIRHLKMHKELAVSIGIDPDNVFIGKNGTVFEFEKNSAKIAGEVQAGKVLVDGLGIGDVGNVVLRDRKHLSEEGLITVVLNYDKNKKQIVGKPQIMSRGFVYVKDSSDLIDGAVKVIDSAKREINNKKISDINFMKYMVKDKLKSFVYSEIKRDPMILPIIMEVETDE